jgi:nucleotide-binding universal stress UspA family protein
MTHHFPPRKLLVPTDLTETSRPAFQFARLWRAQFGGDVHVVHAQQFELPPYFSSGQIQILSRELKKAAKAAAEYLRKDSAAALGFEARVSVVVKPPVVAILEAAEASDADLIVIGTHGRHGAERFWLGSVAERVLRESPKPILAVRQGMTASSFGHILCPVSFSAVAREALQYAAAMAEAGQLRLTVLHAIEEGDKPPDCDLVPEIVRTRCKIEELTYHGDAAGAILTAANDLKPDIIVMGAERKTAALGGLFSSTTERVMQWANVPLLVVPK